jgi:hypothetical protein
MAWFSENNKNRCFKYGSLFGCVVGLVCGFGIGGLGGSILLGIIGTIIGLFIGGMVSIIFDADEMAEIAGCLILIGIPIAIVAVIGALWGVGK